MTGETYTLATTRIAMAGRVIARVEHDKRDGYLIRYLRPVDGRPVRGPHHLIDAGDDSEAIVQAILHLGIEGDHPVRVLRLGDERGERTVPASIPLTDWTSGSLRERLQQEGIIP